MLTECPSCLTVFRVTGAILKMGHGQVRCGKCRTQFDALDSLLDDDEGDADADAQAKAETELRRNAASTPPANVATQSAPEAREESNDDSIEIREPEIAEDITLEGSRIEITGTYRVASDDQNGEAGGEQVIHEHVVIDREEPTLADDDENDNFLGEVPEDQVIVYTADDGEPVANAAEHLMDDANGQSDKSQPLSKRLWKRATGGTSKRTTSQQIEDELYGIAPETSAKERKGLWTTLSVLMVFTLVAQSIHHYRDPLIRSPKWGETVSRFYRVLGIDTTPQWDLRTYKLLQWGLIPAGTRGDELRLRASVTNQAEFAQPYPYIKMSMTNQWKEPVAERVFAPEEYLVSVAAAGRMMTPSQRATAEIVLVDPGADAVNYRVDACLPSNGTFLCSEDLPEIKAPQ